MVREKGENLHAVFILLFLNIAFFFLEHQDPARYAALFSFDAEAVLSGEVWRLFTYQFTQSGQGWFSFPRPVVLFFTLLLLYIMGSAIEEEWGTARFLALFALSTLASAGAAAWLGVQLLGSYFVNFSLLFVYAAVFPQQTFYLFGVVPVRIRWIAWVAAVLLVAGTFAGGASNAAALAGAIAAWCWFLLQRAAAAAQVARPAAPEDDEEESPVETAVIRNAARVVAMKKAIAAQAPAAVDRLTTQFEKEVVQGVNICPPVDFKPDHTDGYCIRCEGFAECSVRFLSIHRPRTDDAGAAAVPEVTPQV
jgi:membrane associated rhomboid family serine protease